MARVDVRLPLHQHQREIFFNRSRYTVIVAGRRFGKTILVGCILIANALKTKGVHAYVAPSYRMAKRIMWEILKRFAPFSLVTKVNETELSIEFKTGGKVQLFGADNPDSLRGLGFSSVAIDEYDMIDSALWEKIIRPTLADTRGEAVFIGTPDGFKNLYPLYQKAEYAPNWVRFQYKSIDNPLLDLKEVEDARQNTDARLFRQEWEACFERPAQVVYPDFDIVLNTGETKYDPRLPLFAGVDFNVDNMTAVLLQEYGNTVHIVDMIELKNSNSQELGSLLKKTYGPLEIWCDPTGNARSHTYGDSDVNILRSQDHKVRWPPNYQSENDKYNAVRAFILTASGNRRLKVGTHCKRLIERLQQLGYSDKDDHCTDALGYLLLGKYNPCRKIRLKDWE